VDATLTVSGNLTGDPTLRFTQSGVAVANFSVAHTPRVFDRQSNSFTDGPTLFVRCTVWRDQAERLAESLGKGARVLVTGTLKPTEWTAEDGSKRSAWELDVDEVAASLRFSGVSVVRRAAAGRGDAVPPSDPNSYGAPGDPRPF
jgi:single-strand DNA-binding protein